MNGALGGWRLAVSAAALTLAAVTAAAREKAPDDPLAGLQVRDGRPGWDGIEVGMSFVQAERRFGTTLPLTERPGARCGRFVSASERAGLTLQVGFPSPKPGAKVETLFVRFEGHQIAASTADLVAALKRKAPAAKYLPDPAQGPSSETEDPAPVYGLADDGEGWAVQLRPRDGMLLARRACLAR
jgi:hypothetical protein